MENALCKLQPEPAHLSEEALWGELNYFRAQRILSAMLERGLVSPEEFREITLRNRQSFIPVLSQIMPEPR